ncbi:MAG: hypothetical protein WDZ80_06455 [Candidatus Paceibacterota bacterium]
MGISTIHRISELAENSIIKFEKKQYISSCILTRSLMESTGVLYWLKSKISRSIEDEDLAGIDNFLMRGMFGFKKVETTEEALSCLTAVQKIDKEHSGYFTYYEMLSEYTHPNFSGTIGSFSQTNKENYTIKFAPYQDKEDWTFILNPLSFSLAIVIETSQGLEGMLSDFIELCNKNLN